jgi:ribonuclease D
MITEDVTTMHGDLDEGWVNRALATGTIAWDIETSGLDWSTESIATCQVATGDDIGVVQLIGGQSPPAVLSSLLADERVTKVFHHAPFDLRFMAHAWSVTPANVACTKVASKITEPGLDRPQYSLKPVLRRYLGVEIDKGEQVSDWTRDSLTRSQLAYAANDVRFLLPLLRAVLDEARRRGVLEQVIASFEYLPTRVALDLRGSGDVYAY